MMGIVWRCPCFTAFAPLGGDGNDFYEGTE